MQKLTNGSFRRAPLQGMLDCPGMVNVYQMGSLQTHLTANAYAKAQGEFQAALDAERAAKAMLLAQLNAAVAEAWASKRQGDRDAQPLDRPVQISARAAPGSRGQARRWLWLWLYTRP